MPVRLRRRKKQGEAPLQESQKNLARPSAREIFEQVAQNAREELKRPITALAFSGFAGGIFMGLTALGNAIGLAMLGDSLRAQVLAKMFYPLGFIVVILGRAQLFTENTLYPVALVLAERKHFGVTMRLWFTVLPANVFGALAFAALASLTSALDPHIVRALAHLGVEATQRSPEAIFWSAVMGGWIIATAAWLVSGSHSISGSIMMVWILTFVVGLGNFAHCIAGAGEVLAAVLTRQIAWTRFPAWFLPAVGGNICGGVGMVTLLEYGQVMVGKRLETGGKDEPEAEDVA